MQYSLTSPLIITSRLMAGVKVGDAVISIEPISWTGNRCTFAYHVEDKLGMLANGADLTVVLMGDESPEVDLPRKAIAALLSFLSSDGESYRRCMDRTPPTDGYAFSEAVAEWAYHNDSEIDSLVCELEGEDA